MNHKLVPQKCPLVKLKPNTYQPNKADLNTDLRVHSTFNRAVKSLVTPIEIKRDIR